MSNLYTTPEAARLTEIPESTIRSWLTRHPGVFQLDHHIVIDDHGVKLWTESGIELLRSRRAGNNATDDVAKSDADNFLERLLDHDATQLAQEYWRQLPGRVLHRIKQMRDNPTPEERELVKLSFQTAIASGTSHLLLPTYQPMLLEGGGDERD